MRRKLLLILLSFILHSLKSSADRKAEAAALTRQKQSRQLFSASDFRIRIVIINQAERNVDDRNLDAQFQTHARTKVAELIKRRFVNAQQRVRLRFAAYEKLLNVHRWAGRTDYRLTENQSELVGRQQLIIERQ